MTRKRGYDPACWELAERFLDTPEAIERYGAALAQHIQDAVEEWMEAPRSAKAVRPQNLAREQYHGAWRLKRNLWG